MVGDQLGARLLRFSRTLEGVGASVRGELCVVVAYPAARELYELRPDASRAPILQCLDLNPPDAAASFSVLNAIEWLPR